MRAFEEVIQRLLERPEMHSRFVNTLSLLEYMGARKILKSQKSETVTAELLAHASEEIRHAQIFKHFALKLSDGRLDSYQDNHLLCGTEARRYLRAVDDAAAKGLGTQKEWGNYLVTTLLIEERATAIYPVYDRILKENGIPNAIGAIIRDEDNHLRAIRAHSETAGMMKPALKTALHAEEQVQFDIFIQAVSRAISESNNVPLSNDSHYLRSGFPN